MKPPICAVCHSRFDVSEGGLVSFKMTEADRLWHERAEQPGFVGHPPNVEWFCGAHIEKAKSLSDDTLGRALALLR